MTSIEPQRLLVSNDGDAERAIPLTGRIVVGRAAECEIRTEDVRASRRHAEFVVDGDAARVRDLASRNGIAVNGVHVVDQRLAAGDTIQIADLVIQYRETHAPPAADGDRPLTPLASAGAEAPLPSVGLSPANDLDATRRIAPPVARAAATAVQAPAADQHATRVLGPPAPVANGNRAGAPPTVVPAVGPPAASTSPASVTPLGEDADSTRAIPRPAPTAARPRPRGSWSGRVTLTAMLLAIVVWAAAALPQASLVGRVSAGNDAVRAAAIASWLAADAARALEAGDGIADAANAVLASPGVDAAMIVDRATGRVLAPGRRAAETIATLPGIGRPPGEVVAPIVSAAGDRVVVATPVTTRDGGRAAVAWTRVQTRPSAAAQSMGSILAMSLLLALGAALVLAALVRRMTMRAMTGLRDDIEAAIGGTLDLVDDPLRAPAMRETVDVINYLVTRVRKV